MTVYSNDFFGGGDGRDDRHNRWKINQICQRVFNSINEDCKNNEVCSYCTSYDISKNIFASLILTEMLKNNLDGKDVNCCAEHPMVKEMIEEFVNFTIESVDIVLESKDFSEIREKKRD